MKLRETIKKILREEYQDTDIEILDVTDGFDVIITSNGEKVGEINFEHADDNDYTIVDANIDPSYRKKGIYQKSILKVFDKKPDIKIYSVFRSPEAERSWKMMVKNLPPDIEYSTKYYPEENTKLYILKKVKT